MVFAQTDTSISQRWLYSDERAMNDPKLRIALAAGKSLVTKTLARAATCQAAYEEPASPFADVCQFVYGDPIAREITDCDQEKSYLLIKILDKYRVLSAHLPRAKAAQVFERAEYFHICCEILQMKLGAVETACPLIKKYLISDKVLAKLQADSPVTSNTPYPREKILVDAPQSLSDLQMPMKLPRHRLSKQACHFKGFLDPDIIDDFHLRLSPQISYRGIKLQVSEFFSDISGRPMCLALVEHHGKQHLRVYYQSHSLGLFRVLPAIFRITWYHNETFLYDKSGGEEMLTLPPGIQKFLSVWMKNSVFRNDLGPFLALGVIPWIELPNRDFGKDFPQYQRKERAIFDTENKFLEPTRRPDFERVHNQFKICGSVTGKVDISTYHSIDEKLEYAVMEDANGSLALCYIGYRKCELNSFGLPLKAFKTEGHIRSLWEYPRQCRDMRSAEHPDPRFNYLYQGEFFPREYDKLLPV